MRLATSPSEELAGSRLAGVGEIHVLRPGGLGDTVFVLPALAALRAAYPEARLVLLGDATQRTWLEGRDLVDEVMPLPLAVLEMLSSPAETGEGGAGEIEAFLEAEVRRNIDLAVQLYGGGARSNVLLRRLGARQAIGLQDVGAPDLDRAVPYRYYQPEVFRALEVAGLAGARPVTLDPWVPVVARDRHEVARLSVDERVPLAVLHPGAGDPRRRWPADRFAGLADRLIDAGATVILAGGPGDTGVVAAVEAAMEREPLTALDRLSVSGLVGLLDRADLLVGNDSGPLHLARAVGCPTVGIFWCGNLINAGSLWRTWDRPILSWRLACPVCGVDCTQGRCGHRPSFVADVPLAPVLAEAQDLLVRAAASRSQRSNEARQSA
jgi:ADP-heptose:LPS heptosyltransferase